MQAGELFCSYYDVSEDGNWEGHNILNVPRDLSVVAKLNRIEPGELREVLRKIPRRSYLTCAMAACPRIAMTRSSPVGTD